VKIAISTSVMDHGRSGVGQYVLSLARALLPAAARHEFTLFVLEEDMPLFEFAAGSMRLVAVSERIRPPMTNILWHQAVLPRLVQHYGIEVLHIPSYRRMLWRRPCALVSTIHDLAPFHIAGKYDQARMFYGRVVARHLARRQDQLIAVSQATARDVESLFRVPSGRLTVIPNGLDHGQFQPGSQTHARDTVWAPRGSGGPFFLYVARLEHPAKNHARLIEAFNRFKAATRSPWRLVLAGADWHGAETIHGLVRASPFAREIDVLGFVPPADLPDWYRAADVFVFPSLHEGFGLPPIEAMACGCPVLSSQSGALGETIGTAAGLLEPNDTAQIEAQLTRVAADIPWRKHLREAGIARARDFDWKATADATIGVYARAGVGHSRSNAANLSRWGQSNPENEVSTQSLPPREAVRIMPEENARPSP
jgi:glycosyltransferase involved in cell wall biosynthesis